MAKKSEYERMGDKAARGEYDLVLPLDYLLLEQLQPEGTMFAGLYQIGTTVESLAAMEQFKPLGRNIISGRMRVLHLQGLVVKVTRLGTSERIKNGAAWQRTKKADELLAAWRANDND